MEFEVINFMFDQNDIDKFINDQEYDVLCLPCYVWNRKKLLHLVKNIKTSTIIWGGPDISEAFIKEAYIKHKNYFIIGEGEKKLELLFMHFLGMCSDNYCMLLPVKKEKTFVVHASLHDNPCSFSQVYTKGLVPDILIRHQITVLETQRGCIFNCSYCNYNQANLSIRYYNLKDVFAELEYLTQKKARVIRITDAVFTSDLKRAKKIIRFLIKLKSLYNYIPTIFFDTYIQCIDEEFISLLEQMKTDQETIHNIKNLHEIDTAQMYTNMANGYKCVLTIGIQSLYAQALKACNRYTPKIDKMQDFIKYIHKYNILLKTDIILGLPMETQDSYLNGLRQMLPIFDGTDYILNIHLLKVLPNTKLMDDHKKYEVIFETNKSNTIETSTMNRNTLFEMKTLSAILFRIINSSLREWFFNIFNNNIDLYDLLITIKEELNRIGQLPKILNTYNELLDDDYWNGAIFQDLKSQTLKDILSDTKLWR